MKFVADIKKNTWELLEDSSGNSFFSLDIYFCFRDNGNLPVIFKDLSFGLYMRDGRGFNYIKEFPEGQSPYISTDQDYLKVCNIHSLIPENTYVLDLWAKNDGKLFEKSFDVTLSKPPQPWPSWTYNEELYLWEPPTPLPQDGNFYDWDEKSLSWLPIEDFS